MFQKIASPRERANAQLSAAMTEDLDTSIGQVLAKLDALGIAENTWVIFTSDNGHQDWNDGLEPLRSGKWWLWDGGLRVPLIVRGPGVAEGTRSAVNVVGYDWLPTFADFAGASAQVPKDVDGVSFKQVLLGGEAGGLANRAIYFHYPHYRVSPPCSAIIEGDRKLLHFYEWPDENFVYDLKGDLGEKNNIATANPRRDGADAPGADGEAEVGRRLFPEAECEGRSEDEALRSREPGGSGRVWTFCCD